MRRTLMVPVALVLLGACAKEAREEKAVAQIAATARGPTAVATENKVPEGIPKLTNQGATDLLANYLDSHSGHGNMLLDKVTLVEQAENHAKVYFRGELRERYQMAYPGKHRFTVTLTWDGEAWQTEEIFVID